MDGIIALAAGNLLSPPVLFFALGLAAALARSDLSIPEAFAKAMSIYLLLAIGFKGGAEVRAHGFDAHLISTLFAAFLLSLGTPFIAFHLLRMLSGLSAVDRAAIAGHYGSISIVTFVAATEAVRLAGHEFEGFLVAAAAVMETPAIFAALFLASRAALPAPAIAAAKAGRPASAPAQNDVMREILFNGSIVVLVGAFLIGLVTGEAGFKRIEGFIVTPFQGVLCLFLLDMGLLAGRNLAEGRRHLTSGVIAFGILMPLISALIAALVGQLIGLSVGGHALLIALAASASYIAAPAAMRVALPKASPAIYLTLSLGVTFPFNLTVGIPLYIALASLLG